MRLDEEQHRAVAVEPNQRQVVIAGPGSGKTHVVSCLVERLVSDEGVDPAHGLLVLSFSNAAVQAVAARVREKEVPPVDVRTLDSLAMAIIESCTDEGGVGLSFEARVVRATEVLRSRDWDDADDLEHLVVDEVQDLVGVRADFLLALVDALPTDAGVTLLGDPAQAIYDFQLVDGEGTTSAQLIEAVRGKGARTVVLKGQYRARGRDACSAMSLRSPGEDVADPHDVEDFWNEVLHVGTVVEAWEVLRTRIGTTAFLTPTNGQALLVAQELRAAGALVRVQRGAQDQAVAAWVARVCRRFERGSVGREQFELALQEVDPHVDAHSAWRALRSVSSTRGKELDLVRLASRLRTGRVLPVELREAHRSGVVVSTVHRAKGLEYDNVVVVEFSSGKGLVEDEQELSRTRFVALTRARDLLVRADGPVDKSVYRFTPRPPATPRWIRGGYKKWQTFGLEIRLGDVAPCDPGGGNDVDELLADDGIVGRGVRLTPDSDRSTLSMPTYRVQADDVVIGMTTEPFGTDLVGRLGPLENARRGWPALSGVVVEGVSTVVDESLSFRLAPIVTGMADIEWSSADE